MPPAYMTMTRSARRAMTPRSWVMSAIAMPKSRRSCDQQLQDLRLHRHVERGGRLVGDQQFRAAEQRHGDHHALAHAAGEFVRIHVDAALGLGDLHLVQHARPTARPPVLSPAPYAGISTSVIWRRTVR